jgi:hypothetical protein
VQERLVSAMLQSRLDELSQQMHERLSEERRQSAEQIAQRAAALDATHLANAAATARRCKLLTAQVAQARAENLALKNLNAQLLNEADPLVIATPSKLTWPRNPSLQPPALVMAPKDAPGSFGLAGAYMTGASAALSPRTPKRAASPGRAQRPMSAGPTAAGSPRRQAQPPSHGGPHAQPSPTGGTALVQASSGLSNARIIRRQAPPLFDALEAVVLKREQRAERIVLVPDRKAVPGAAAAGALTQPSAMPPYVMAMPPSAAAGQPRPSQRPQSAR